MVLSNEKIRDFLEQTFYENNFWVGIDNTNCPDGKDTSEWVADEILKGNSITLYDIEDEDVQWELTLEKVENGLKQYAIDLLNHQNVEHFLLYKDALPLQYALFGKEVYA